MHELEIWLRSRGVYLNPALYLEAGAAGTGVYLRQGHDILPDELLASIPLSCILSRKTSSLQIDLTAIESHAMRLAALVCHEMLLGQTSPWEGYLYCLPVRVALYYTWPEDVKGLVKATDLGRYSDFDAQLPTVFKTIVLPTLEKQTYATATSVSYDQYSRAYQLVQSRAFWVDAEHELSLVPLADIFNHSAEPHTQLETEDHSDMAKTADMRASRSINQAEDGSGQFEIFNTYGPLTNAQLVFRYGFLLEANPHDRITWPSATEIASQLGYGWTSLLRQQYLARLPYVRFGSGDPLTCPTIEAEPRQHFIDADARLSSPLLLLLVTLASPASKSPNSNHLAAVDVEAEVYLNDNGLIRSTTDLILQLCTIRLAALNPTNASIEEMFNLKERAEEVEGIGSPSCMAYTLVIEERLRLQTCMTLWLDLAGIDEEDEGDIYNSQDDI